MVPGAGGGGALCELQSFGGGGSSFPGVMRSKLAGFRPSLGEFGGLCPKLGRLAWLPRSAARAFVGQVRPSPWCVEPVSVRRKTPRGRESTTAQFPEAASNKASQQNDGYTAISVGGPGEADYGTEREGDDGNGDDDGDVDYC